MTTLEFDLSRFEGCFGENLPFGFRSHDFPIIGQSLFFVTRVSGQGGQMHQGGSTVGIGCRFELFFRGYRAEKNLSLPLVTALFQTECLMVESCNSDRGISGTLGSHRKIIRRVGMLTPRLPYLAKAERGGGDVLAVGVFGDQLQEAALRGSHATHLAL